MTHATFKLRTVMLAGGMAFATLMVPAAIDSLGNLDLGLIATVQAADDGGSSPGGSKGSAGHKGKAGSQKGSQGQGGSASNKIFRIPAAAEDSDRPAWAGIKGGKAGGGGQPPGAGTKKGDDYGDMVVLLRDENGEPILIDGLVQVIAYVYDDAGSLVPLRDKDGNLVTIPYVDGELATTIDLPDAGGVITTYEVYGAEVDLGRLSVSRSPTKVLQHSLDEALAKLTTPNAVIALDASGRLTVDGVSIDSPLDNLALYEIYMRTGTIPGVTLPDGFNPAALLAAAADKTGSITVDTVIYMNTILGINTGETYYDFSNVDYDRYETWKDVTAIVLVAQTQPDGSVVYVPQLVNLYEAVFNSTTWTDPTHDAEGKDAGGADDFAAAANDYLQVIEFIHDNAQ